MPEGAVELPGSRDHVPDSVLELVEAITDSDRILRYETVTTDGDEKTVYVIQPFDEGDDPVFAAYVRQNFRRENLTNRNSLIYSLKSASVGELLDRIELPEDVATWYDDTLALGNPLDGIHVFVQTHDDGRKKDRLRLFEGDSETAIRADADLPRPESGGERVYHYAGTVREVAQGDGSVEIDPDFKKSQWSSYPWSLGHMVEGSVHEELRMALSGGDDGSQ